MGELRRDGRGKDDGAVGRDSGEGPIPAVFTMQYLLGAATHLPFMGGKLRKGMGIHGNKIKFFQYINIVKWGLAC
jgi:hypothetical protein